MPTISPQENTNLWILLDSPNNSATQNPMTDPWDSYIYRFMNAYGKLVDK